LALREGDAQNIAWRRDGKENILTVAHTTGHRGVNVILRLAGVSSSEIQVNGKAVHAQQETFQGVETGTVHLLLSPGKTATVEFSR